MKIKKTTQGVSKLFSVFLFCTLFFIFIPQTEAGKKPLPIEGVSYNVNTSLADNLKSMIGKKVYIHLDSGTTLSGNVKALGNHFLHLEKLDGKNFSDALIRIDNIIAIDTQFRKY